MHSGINPSLNPNCRYQLSLQKFNLTIFYLPPYKQLVWHYQQANTAHTKRAIGLFDWGKSLILTSINRFLSTKRLWSFIPRKTIPCNDKDLPSMNKQIKAFNVEKPLFINVLSEEYWTLIYLINLMFCKLNCKVQAIFFNLNGTEKSLKIYLILH